MEFLPQSIQELIQNQPTWVYILVVVIPFCMALSFREFMCWFWKLNKVVSRLERIDKSLRQLEQVMSKQTSEPEQRDQQPHIVPAAKTGNAEDVPQGPLTTGSEEFKLE